MPETITVQIVYLPDGITVDPIQTMFHYVGDVPPPPTHDNSLSDLLAQMKACNKNITDHQTEIVNRNNKITNELDKKQDIAEDILSKIPGYVIPPNILQNP